MNANRSIVLWTLLLAALSTITGPAAERLEFTRMVAHWADYADPGYLPFIEEAKPEVVQVGFYGAHFWSLADTPFGSGYPAHLPVRGHRECAEWFKRLNTDLHARGAKVIGHMNVKFLVGDPESAEGPRGFFRFYRDQWDEKLLGPKPVPDPLISWKGTVQESRSRTKPTASAACASTGHASTTRIGVKS